MKLILNRMRVGIHLDAGRSSPICLFLSRVSNLMCLALLDSVPLPVPLSHFPHCSHVATKYIQCHKLSLSYAVTSAMLISKGALWSHQLLGEPCGPGRCVGSGGGCDSSMLIRPEHHHPLPISTISGKGPGVQVSVCIDYHACVCCWLPCQGRPAHSSRYKLRFNLILVAQ